MNEELKEITKEELEKLKKLPKGSCKYPNMQQLPHDPITRSCFISEKGAINNIAPFCNYYILSKSFIPDKIFSILSSSHPNMRFMKFLHRLYGQEKQLQVLVSDSIIK